MSHNLSPQGLALALVWVGIVLAVTATASSLITGESRLMGIAAVGFFVQFAGWVRHGRRTGGAA
ncbi:hypothetical protein U9R90_17995 [Streptomyces sp. E11-3]|uniref:hypothetical protein n=1 Tax=Streptomyces sp. E11-3 TaxID=3110112 RepID=UPI00398106B6